MEKNKVIRKANERLEYLTGNAEVKRIAELRDRNMKAMNTHIAGERMEAKAEGIKEGEARGRAEGIREGETRGRIEGERNKNIEIAKEMKKNGFKNEVIAKILKISEKEIAEILK